MAHENTAHAPGKLARGESLGETRQRHREGAGGGVMKGESFGVGPLPGTRTTHNQGEHMPHDGVHLHDEHRAGPPAIEMGKGHMAATAHSHHGPHHHMHEHHEAHAPKGTQPHHIGGAHHSGRGK